MKTLILFFVLFFGFLAYNKQILTFFDKVFDFITFIFKRDRIEFRGRVTSFIIKENKSLWALEMDHHLCSYYIRIRDEAGKKIDVFVPLKSSYKNYVSCYRDNDNTFLLKKNILKSVYEVYSLEILISPEL